MRYGDFMAARARARKRVDESHGKSGPVADAAQGAVDIMFEELEREYANQVQSRLNFYESEFRHVTGTDATNAPSLKELPS